jgi:hypothetical protein
MSTESSPRRATGQHPNDGHELRLLNASVLKLVLRLAPDAVFDLEALLTAAIFPEISDKGIEKSDM